MKISREQHWQFLEEELRAISEEFKGKLETPAIHLMMEEGEVFTAQFLSFNEKGEMCVRFACNRPIPRRGDYLYCMTVHKEYCNYKNWGRMTYGDLVKNKTNQTEAVCNWISNSDDPRFMIAGFIGIDNLFADWIKDVPHAILVMGPNRPPYEYLAHLQSLVKSNHFESFSSVVDADFINTSWKPTLLDSTRDIPKFLETQLTLSDTLILQGPPGTGKTYQISKLCANLCQQGKSLLITALTNRALIEIAKQDCLRSFINQGCVYKSKLTADEAKEVPGLQSVKKIKPQEGCLMLATFYVTSGVASELSLDYPFDYVIVDEASQALLAMIGATRILGKKSIYVGDVEQLPPVVTLKEKRIENQKYLPLVEGLNTITLSSLFPIYQLTETYRLSHRSASYTDFFIMILLFPNQKTNQLSYIILLFFI